MIVKMLYLKHARKHDSNFPLSAIQGCSISCSNSVTSELNGINGCDDETNLQNQIVIRTYKHDILASSDLNKFKRILEISIPSLYITQQNLSHLVIHVAP